jgi:EpsI family protein
MSEAQFVSRKHISIVAAVLAFQALLSYTAGGENVPLLRPLSEFPGQVAQWKQIRESVIEQEVRDVLRADDILSRVYSRPDGIYAGFFVAYFRSQRTGQAPHSPQNCLPGSGYVPSRIGTIRVDIPGRAQPAEINRYVVAKGDEKSVVLYWYQSRDRMVAGEFSAKFWLVADSIRYRRSDTALVRIVVPVGPAGEEAATEAALDLVRSSSPNLREFLPS